MIKSKKVLTFVTALGLVLGIAGFKADTYANSSSYTVTFRPGNVGYFSMNGTDSRDKKSLAQEVAANEYASYEYEVTENGAIKVTVPAGGKMPKAPVHIVTNGDYVVKNSFEWGPDPSSTVDRNVDFVVDYGKLVDGVEYIVRYVDSKSKEQIAIPYIARANVGDKVEIEAVKDITLEGNVVYKSTGSNNKSIVLTNVADSNVLEFEYVSDASQNTETQVITTYKDVTGPTETRVIRVEAPAPVVTVNNQRVSNTNAGNNGAGNTNNQNGGNENNQNGGNADVQNADNQNDDQNADNQNVDTDANVDENDNTVTIEDNEIPLDDGIDDEALNEEVDEEEPSHETIDEENVPLADKAGIMDNKAYIIAAVVAILLLFGIIGVAFGIKKKNSR
ncbi:MAG: hypothetical protein K6F84_04290 [Lachnospiraceae bacterium]|nr:hypothetical protein [Lachnospiraceae bacterium]